MGDVCPNCGGESWVCENHPNKPWNALGCKCGAGMPCRVCKSPTGWSFAPMGDLVERAYRALHGDTPAEELNADELADVVERLATRIQALEGERDEALAGCDRRDEELIEAELQITYLKDLLKEAGKALEPFAEHPSASTALASGWSDAWLSFNDFRRAADLHARLSAFLNPAKSSEQEGGE